jgi:hypothetical protein
VELVGLRAVRDVEYLVGVHDPGTPGKKWSCMVISHKDEHEIKSGQS